MTIVRDVHAACGSMRVTEAGARRNRAPGKFIAATR